MCKLFLGIACLGTPHGFSHAGIFLGPIILVVVTTLCIYTIFLQSEARNRAGNHVKSYSDLGMAVYGTLGKTMTDVFLCIAQFGIGVAYLVFNGTQINQVICYESQGEVCGLKNTYIWIVVCLLTPIIWIKTMKKLSIVSIFALSVMFVSVFTIIYYSVIYISEDTYPSRDIKGFDILESPLFFGIAILNFEGNPASINVQASMKNPLKFKNIVFAAGLSVGTIVVVMSSFAYLAFGSYVEDLITLNLPHTPFTTLIRLCYSLGLILSFPI